MIFEIGGSLLRYVQGTYIQYRILKICLSEFSEPKMSDWSLCGHSMLSQQHLPEMGDESSEKPYDLGNMPTDYPGDLQCFLLYSL